MKLQRRFAIIGHKAPSSGEILLNDLPGFSGRMDVIARAINATLFLSHGIRNDSQIIIHLNYLISNIMKMLIIYRLILTELIKF